MKFCMLVDLDITHRCRMTTMMKMMMMMIRMMMMNIMMKIKIAITWTIFKVGGTDLCVRGQNNT